MTKSSFISRLSRLSLFALLLLQCWNVYAVRIAARVVNVNSQSTKSNEIRGESNTNQRERSQSRKQIINFLAGGLAGTVSSTLTAPLEVVKTQLQSSSANRLLPSLQQRATPITICKQIMKVEGIPGFFRGIKPMLFGIIPTRAIYFWAYGASKQLLSTTMSIDATSPVNHVISAFAAGMTSNTITNPLWLVKTRFQLLAGSAADQMNHKTYGDIVKAIWKEEGPLGFFKGLSASYVGCFEGAIQWLVYEKAKVLLATSALPTSSPLSSSSSSATIHSNGKDTKAVVHTPLNSASGHRQPTAFEYSMAAAFAKAVAILATYPHEVVRTRLREQATNGVFRYKNFASAIRLIAAEEGMRGLYGGMGMHLMRSVPNAAIMYTVFELTGKFLNELDSRAAGLEMGIHTKTRFLSDNAASKKGTTKAVESV